MLVFEDVDTTGRLHSLTQIIICLQCRRPRFNLWVRKIPWRREWLPSVLAWIIPWTEEPGGLRSTGSQRVGHDLATYHTSKDIDYSDSLKFHIMPLVYFRISRDTTLHLVTVPSEALIDSVSQTFLAFDDFDSFKENWPGVFEMPMVCDLSDGFLMIKLRLYVWGRKIVEIKCRFLHILLKTHAVNTTCDCWRWPWSPGWHEFVMFSHSKVTPLMSILYHSEGINICSSYPRRLLLL